MEFQTFVPTPDRPGIGLAVQCIILALREALKQTTAIVLPPRYGKSDVIRLAAIEAKHMKLISVAVVLVPWVSLRTQIIKKDKIEDMATRYFVNAKAPPRKVNPDELKEPFSWRFDMDSGGGRSFWATTIPQASQPASLSSLCQAATFYKTSGLPPLLAFIDEGQYVGGTATPGQSQQWITIATRLVHAGAHVVVLTGTPDRSDKTIPFGFDPEEIDRRDHHIHKQLRAEDEQLYLDIYDGQLVSYELKADFRVSLKAAWDQEDPLILTKLHARWCGFPVDNKPVEEISDPKEIRRALAIALRQDSTMAELLECGIEDVAVRRKTRPDSAMLVFVGNDQRDEDSKDWHPRAAKRIAKRLWRAKFGADPSIVIATLDERGDGKAAEKAIKEFTTEDNPKGDILIVKMMGSVGMDAARIKTIVDLSTVRTISNTTQRWLRACTTWHNIKASTIVLPKDRLTLAVWKIIVEANNGGFKRFENGTLIDSIEIEPDPGFEPPTIGQAYRAGSSDATTRQSIDAIIDVEVDKVLTKTPVLIERLSRVEIADMIATGVINVPADVEPIPTVVVDIPTEINVAMDRINDTALKIAKKITPYRGSVNGEDFSITIQGVYNTIANRAGIMGQIRRCRDLEKLHKAEIEAEAYLSELGG